ncbi:hypothetical protein [Acinetobacter beijerinckii]|uniref:hypothetical protein n=1 Tax=Acinetobacter beijerinckii TaxID=262668 RepID=UPI0030DB0038
MNEIRRNLVIGDTLFGTWTYVDDDGNPVQITDSLEFTCTARNNGNLYPVSLSILDQEQFPGEIAFSVQTIGWKKGNVEIDIKAISGIYIKHSDKRCITIVEGVT